MRGKGKDIRNYRGTDDVEISVDTLSRLCILNISAVEFW